MSFAKTEIERTTEVLRAMVADASLIDMVDKVSDACVTSIKAGGKVLFAGNGGSAADAQHLSAELLGKLSYDRPGMASISLTVDTSVLTAIGNDYSYEQVFERQVNALGQPGDVLICISTSGRSKNLLTALKAAKAKGIITVGMTGATGGDMLPLCDMCLRVPSTDTQKVQEGQIVLGHIFCGLIERAIYPRAA